MFDSSITSLRRHGAFQTTDLAMQLAVTMVAKLYILAESDQYIDEPAEDNRFRHGILKVRFINRGLDLG